MNKDDTSPTARPCCFDARFVECSECESLFCSHCEPGLTRPPYQCRKCRKGATSHCCTCGDTLWRCWSCDRRQCPRCWRVLGVTPYQCRFCGKEDSGLADKQTTHDIGAVLEVARRENEGLEAGCKACVSAITGLLTGDGLPDCFSSDWRDLRDARRIAQAAIDKAEGQPADTGSDRESGASTKVSSPPSDDVVVAMLVGFLDKMKHVMADLREQGSPTETPTQEPEA